jgi:four helix bundle protein
MNNFRTYQLALEFYRASKGLALTGPLKAQFERASSSVVLNLAEGWGRIAKRDQQRFYRIALGSLRECQAILEIAEDVPSPAKELADKTGAALYRLVVHYQRG